MGVLTYTARRNIIASHTLNLQYSIENAFQVIDPSISPAGTELMMLDAGVEYELDNDPEIVAIMSDVVVEANKLLWKEFLTSIHAREQFTIDLTGTIAAPGTSLSCKIKSGGYRPVRTAPGVQTYRFSFSVRLL